MNASQRPSGKEKAASIFMGGSKKRKIEGITEEKVEDEGITETTALRAQLSAMKVQMIRQSADFEANKEEVKSQNPSAIKQFNI